LPAIPPAAGERPLEIGAGVPAVEKS
jgi:hypothetical protein